MVFVKPNEFEIRHPFLRPSRQPFSYRFFLFVFLSLSLLRARLQLFRDEAEANLLLRDPRRLDCANGEPLSPPGRRIGLSLFLPSLPDVRSDSQESPSSWKIDGKAFRRRKFVLSRLYRAFASYPRSLAAAGYLTLIPLREGIRA